MMPIEIERKFRVACDAWREAAGPGLSVRQGYIIRSAKGQVRVRRAGASAVVTIKGAKNGIVRAEFEYPIPVEDAEEMLRSLCAKPLVEKTRYEVIAGGRVWEVDHFHGIPDPEGDGDLFLAELELAAPDERVVPPYWVGREVTHEERYSNAFLALSRRPRPMEVAPPHFTAQP
jgi:CYTH domain-containing protein